MRVRIGLEWGLSGDRMASDWGRMGLVRVHNWYLVHTAIGTPRRLFPLLTHPTERDIRGGERGVREVGKRGCV